MTSWLNIFKHVLPRGRAWYLTVQKTLRAWFEGIAIAPEEVEAFYDDIYDDLRPQTTRELPEWEAQFGLGNSNLTEQERRDRLEAEWSATGGQDPTYIQETLRGAGFDVYVHEWWEPGTEDAPVVRNPQDVLQATTGANLVLVTCGNLDMTCGQLDATCGNSDDPAGYPLVNKAPEAGGGGDLIIYVIPGDSATWPYFFYIGAQTFPDLATIPSSRRNEFETLCLKISPTEQWLGILVEYT